MAVTVDADIGQITRNQFAQLMKVEPSVGDKYQRMEYRPCRVTLNDGRAFDRVYVQNVLDLVKFWGMPPGYWAQQPIKIEAVAKIESSPVRLPVRLANRLYQIGESGMGYCLFSVQLKDGRQLPYVTGNAVDFPNWPPGVTPEIIQGLSGESSATACFRNRKPLKYEESAGYFWCAYGMPALAGREGTRPQGRTLAR